MKNTGLIKSWSEAIASRNISVASNLLLAASIFGLVWMLFFKPPHVVAIPENEVFGRLEVVGNRANQNYQQSWAFAVANLLGNINPNNVKFVKKGIMNVLSPRLKVQMEPMIDRQVELIRQRGIRQVFIVDDLIHEPESDLISVWGQKLTFLEGKPRADTKWTYEMKIVTKNGKPRVVHLDQYPGTPRKRKKRSNGKRKGKQKGVNKQVINDQYYDTELELQHLKTAQEFNKRGTEQ